MLYWFIQYGCAKLSFFRGLLFTCVSLFLCGCAPAPQEPLRVATLTWPGYESLHLAQSLGYINPQDIRTVELMNTSQIAAVLRSGTVDAGMVTLDSALTLLQEGIELQVVLVMDFSLGADALLVRPELTELAQLRGQRVGVENAAVGGVMLDAALTEAGLTVSDIMLLSLTVNEQAAAYRQGEVDAVVTFDPVRSELLREGARNLYDSSRIPNRILDVLVVRKETLPTHQTELVKLVSAHFRALDYMHKSPREAYAYIAPFLGVPPEDVAAQFAGIAIPTLTDNYRLLGGAGPELQATAEQLAHFMLERQLLYRLPKLETLLEPAFLPSPPVADLSLGVDR